VLDTDGRDEGLPLLERGAEVALNRSGQTFELVEVDRRRPNRQPARLQPCPERVRASAPAPGSIERNGRQPGDDRDNDGSQHPHAARAPGKLARNALRITATSIPSWSSAPATGGM